MTCVLRVVLLCAAALLTAHSSAGASRAEWMRGSVGVGVHWTPLNDCSGADEISFSEAVERFDAVAFAERLRQVGARHCVFTLSHALQRLPMPNAALDAIDPGRTSRRDLFGEILDACAERGVRVVAYYNHGCNGESKAVSEWKAKVGFYDAAGAVGPSRFSSNVCAIVADVSRRYGRRLSGWWFDSAYSVDASGPNVYSEPGRRFPWADLLAAARSGNPDAAIALNAGVGRHFQYAQDVDFCAGEAVWPDEPFSPAARADLVDSRWICADDPEWIYSRRRGFLPLRFDDDFLRAYTLEHVACGRMVTFNVLIDRAGNFSPVLGRLGKIFSEPSPADGWAFRFDASVRTVPSCCRCAPGAAVKFSTRADGRAFADFGALCLFGQVPQSTTNGEARTAGWLMLTNQIPVRTAFVALRFFDRAKQTFPLGCTGGYDLHWGHGGLLDVRWASSAAMNARWRIDGRLADPLEPYCKTAWHVVEFAADDPIPIDTICRDRDLLEGGAEIGEVLLYTRNVSRAERAATELYLSRKWRVPAAPN